LRPGILRVVAGDGTKAFVVTGGFAEISASGVSVLAEQAVPLDELTPAALEALITDASAALAGAADKDSADKTLADLAALRAAAGH
jgi:F-type H+-transporting ATPase subunit epsilon